jgi:hypothetical protein
MDRQDAEAIAWMHQHTRNRFPKKIVWKQDDVVEPRFYWLSIPSKEARDRALVIAKVDGQTIEIEQSDQPSLDILLRDDLVDMSRPVAIRFADCELVSASVPRTILAMEESLSQRGDSQGVYWGKLSVSIPESKE